MIDQAKLPQPVRTRGGRGRTARLDIAIYVTRNRYVAFTQKGGVSYQVGQDRLSAHEALDIMLDRAQSMAG